MDHDRLFKQLLTTFFLEFVALFLPELSACLGRGRIEFMDKEIFTDLLAGDRHEVDLLAKVKFKEADAFFLIHVESQAKRKAGFGKRMFQYFARVHEMFDLPVYPVALFSYDRPKHPEPTGYDVSFPDMTVMAFNFRVIQLNQLNWRDFLRQPNPVAAALMTKMKIAPEDRPRVKLECLRMIATLKLDPARSELIGEFMNAYLALTAAENRVYNRQLDTLEPDEKRSVVQTYNEWTLGGMHKKAVQVAVRQFEHRFGLIPAEIRKKIEKMSEPTLDELSVAILDFPDVAGAKRWIKTHR